MLWSFLRNRQLLGVKFRRQVPIGPFVADFASLNPRFVIELDGGQHSERQVYDARRTAFLERRGFTVLRFWNTEVSENLEGVWECIEQALAALAPSPGARPLTRRFAPPSPAPREREERRRREGEGRSAGEVERAERSDDRSGEGEGEGRSEATTVRVRVRASTITARASPWASAAADRTPSPVPHRPTPSNANGGRPWRRRRA